MEDLGCAVNHVLSCHCFRFLLLFFRSLLGYLKSSNAAAHSDDSDIFYIVSATNVSQFARARKRHEQQCFRNNVSSFTTAFTS